MDLQIKGSIKNILEEQSGTGKNGKWRKRDFILETEGKYPKKVCITQWGDNIDKANVQKGEQVVAHIDIQSREYKGKWYTDVKAWKVEKGANAQADPSAEDEEVVINLSASDIDDEVPF